MRLCTNKIVLLLVVRRVVWLVRQWCSYSRRSNHAVSDNQFDELAGGGGVHIEGGYNPPRTNAVRDWRCVRGFHIHTHRKARDGRGILV